MSSMKPSLEEVLEKAAQLQELVPGAVLVGGSAAALYAHHRQSFDHDHVVTDLAERFDTILEHLEALGDWSMTRAQPGKIILGELGGIETGVRQLLRSRPLESTEVELGGRRLAVPTAAEILRIKAWLALSRNQTRDYLDIAALAERIGLDEAAAVLADMDDYYADINTRPEAWSPRSWSRHARGPEAARRRGHHAARRLQGAAGALARLVRGQGGARGPRGEDVAMTAMRTRFRNLEFDLDAPLDEWPAEAIETIVDRGSLSDWRELARTIRRNPWGPAARTTEIVAGWGEHYGVDALMTGVIAHAREDVARRGRAEYAAQIRAWRTRRPA